MFYCFLIFFRSRCLRDFLKANDLFDPIFLIACFINSVFLNLFVSKNFLNLILKIQRCQVSTFNRNFSKKIRFKKKVEHTMIKGFLSKIQSSSTFNHPKMIHNSHPHKKKSSALFAHLTLSFSIVRSSLI